MNTAMDMGFHLDGDFARAMMAGAAEADLRPDWHALRTRFTAAAAARRAVDQQACPPDGPGDSIPAGSFDAASAGRIAGYGHNYAIGLAGVNRSVLANGKTGAGISAAPAGIHTAGGRG